MMVLGQHPAPNRPSEQLGQQVDLASCIVVKGGVKDETMGPKGQKGRRLDKQ